MLTLLIVLAAATTDPEPVVMSTDNPELDAYLIEAADNHPLLLQRYAEWLAAMERIPQVTALDDPMFTYGQFLQSEVSRFKASVSQRFPWFGTLKARGDKATAEAEAALNRFYAARNRIFADVKRTYYEAAFLEENVKLTKSQAEILQYIEELVQSNLALGLAAEDEVLRVSIEKSKLEDRAAELEQIRPVVHARFNEALGRPVDAEVSAPTSLGTPPDELALSLVTARIRSANPILAAYEQDIAAAQHASVLARKETKPQFAVGLEYQSLSKPREIRPERPYPSTLNAAYRLASQTGNNVTNLIDAYSLATRREPFVYSDGGDDNISVSLSLSVPIWRKKTRAKRAEAEHREDAARHAKNREAHALDTVASETLYRLQDAHRRKDLYETTLIPQASLSFESVQTAYATGDWRVTFLDMLQSVQTLLEFEREQLRAVADGQIAAADLTFLMGGTWPEDEDETP
jgi:outer membrane protein TolC